MGDAAWPLGPFEQPDPRRVFQHSANRRRGPVSRAMRGTGPGN